MYILLTILTSSRDDANVVAKCPSGAAQKFLCCGKLVPRNCLHQSFIITPVNIKSFWPYATCLGSNLKINVITLKVINFNY